MRKPNPAIAYVLLTVAAATFAVVRCQSLEDPEKVALLTFKRAADKPDCEESGTCVLYNWNLDTNKCNFFGVACNGEDAGDDDATVRNVTAITIPPPDFEVASKPGDNKTLGLLEFSLVQTTVFDALQELRRIEFSGHAVDGSLPAEYTNIPVLQDINYSGNKLAIIGTIPAEWSSLPSLRNITIVGGLSDNSEARLSGTLPPNWSTLAQIEAIALTTSRMTGTLPEAWSRLQNLVTLSLQTERNDCAEEEEGEEGCFQGTIPSGWNMMTRLAVLHLGASSQIKGTIGFLDRLTGVRDIRIPSAILTGTLPVGLSNWENLRIADLSSNKLKGPIPSEWYSFQGRLQTLNLSFNENICQEGENTTEVISAGLCAPMTNGDCLDVNGTLLADGTACTKDLGTTNIIIAAVVSVAIFGIGICVAIAILNYIHKRRRKRPLMPLFDGSSVDAARAQYASYMQLAPQNTEQNGAANPARAAALDAFNPDNMDTMFFNKFEAANAQANAAHETQKKMEKSPFAATDIQGNREVGNYWPAEKGDVVIQTRTPEQVAEELAERERAEKERRRQQVLATTHQASMAMFGAVMLPVADFYGREALEEQQDRETPKMPTWSGGFPSLEEAMQNKTKSVLLRSNSIKPLPALWKIGSFDEVKDIVDLNVDFQREVQPFIEERIGGGAFGDVYKGTFRGQPTAIKLFSRYYQGDQEELMSSFVSEVKLMSKFQNCDRIVKILGASLEQPYVCILLEYVGGPSLANRIYDDKQPPLSYRYILELAHDIASALAYLHPTVVHRDLKPDNILLDSNGRAKLIDFGISRGKDPFKSYIMTQTGGTPIYMAPEQFNSPKFDEKADVYALGCILYEMYTRQTPWKGYSHFCQIILAVALNKERPSIPDDCPENLRRLITKCWRQEPGSRPSCAEIVRLLEIMLSELRVNEREASSSVLLESMPSRDDSTLTQEAKTVRADDVSQAMATAGQKEESSRRSSTAAVTDVEIEALSEDLPKGASSDVKEDEDDV